MPIRTGPVFYPESDLHVTVLDLISARDDFKQSCAVCHGKFMPALFKKVDRNKRLEFFKEFS